MADEKPPEPTDPPVPTRDQVIAFLRAKTPDGAPCPVCASQNWSIGREPLDYLTNRIMQKSIARTVLDGTVTPTVLLACNNCGYIREHSAMMITEWVRANAAG